ncbi:MAG: hypothetical protein FWE88_07325 [Phycisphaerae bacterium]|nr:hypothetical protein [Phycisphaerae bacterium]
MERLFSTYQVAELLGVTTWVVSAWMRQGLLKYQQLPQGALRVSERNLVSFLRSQHIDLGAMVAEIASAETVESAARTDASTRAARSIRATVAVAAAPEAEPAAALAVAQKTLPAGGASRPMEAANPGHRLQPGDEPPPAHAAQQVLQAVLRDALARRAQGVQFTLDGPELTLALRVDGRLKPKPNFHTRLPKGLGDDIVAHALERTQMPAPTPLSSGAMSLRFEGRDVAMTAWACRIGNTTRLVFTLPCPPRRIEELLPVGHARTLQKALENRSGLILLAGPMDRCRHVLDAARARMEDAGRSVLELPRTTAFASPDVQTLLATPDPLAMDALLVEEFSRYDDLSIALDACRRTLILAVVPEDSSAGLAAFLRQADAPAWELARSLQTVGILDTEGGVIRAADATLREKIRNGEWDWGL